MSLALIVLSVTLDDLRPACNAKQDWQNHTQHTRMNEVITMLAKNAQLQGKKRTLIEFYNHYDDCTVYKFLPPGCDRVQDFLDVLNEMEEYDLTVVGWEYLYTTEDDY